MKIAERKLREIVQEEIQKLDEVTAEGLNSWRQVFRGLDMAIDALERVDPQSISIIEKRDLLVYWQKHLKQEVERIVGTLDLSTLLKPRGFSFREKERLEPDEDYLPKNRDWPPGR